MLAMRPAFDHIVASAVRLSIAAAMVIAKPVTGNRLQFSALANLRREMSTKSNNNAVAAGHARPYSGAGRWHRTTGFCGGGRWSWVIFAFFRGWSRGGGGAAGGRRGV